MILDPEVLAASEEDPDCKSFVRVLVPMQFYKAIRIYTGAGKFVGEIPASMPPVTVDDRRRK